MYDTMLCFDPLTKDIFKIATLSTVLLYFALYPRITFSVYQRLQSVNNVLQKYQILAAMSSFLPCMRAFHVRRILESRIALYAAKKEA